MIAERQTQQNSHINLFYLQSTIYQPNLLSQEHHRIHHMYIWLLNLQPIYKIEVSPLQNICCSATHFYQVRPSRQLPSEPLTCQVCLLKVTGVDHCLDSVTYVRISLLRKLHVTGAQSKKTGATKLKDSTERNLSPYLLTP